MPIKACIEWHCLQISGAFNIDGSGNVELKEEDGIDYAAVTVQMPGGERVPFLFTIKELEAKGTADAFGGEFVVPSYRGSSFLDPKASSPPFAKEHLKSAKLPYGLPSIIHISTYHSIIQRTRLVSSAALPCNNPTTALH